MKTGYGIKYLIIQLLQQILLKKTDKPWNLRYISTNPNITMDYIEKNPDKDWNWNSISHHSHLVSEFEKYPDKPWDWDLLASNNYLTFEIVKNNPYRRWSFIKGQLINLKHICKYL